MVKIVVDVTSQYFDRLQIMPMGRRRKRVRQAGLWTPTAALPLSASHQFYQRLNQILDERKFDKFVETICEDFYAGEVGRRPSLTAGTYFRLLMVGYFEGIDSEHGIAWRASDSMLVRSFARIALDESVPDDSAISRIRQQIDIETHHAVFQWVLVVLAEEELLKKTTIGLAATTKEATAALRSIVRRDTGGRYEEFLTRLAKESSIETPTRKQLAKLDRRRLRGSNDDCTHPQDPNAITNPIPDAHLVRKTRAATRWRTISLDEETHLGSFNLGPHTIDLDASMVRTTNREILLTPMEDCVLKHLAAHRNVPVRHGELAKSLWGAHSGKGVHSLRCFIRSLRKKLELDPAHPQYIVTVPGIGYCLRP